MNLFTKLINIIVGNWRNLTGYTSDEQKEDQIYVTDVNTK